MQKQTPSAIIDYNKKMDGVNPNSVTTDISTIEVGDYVHVVYKDPSGHTHNSFGFVLKLNRVNFTYQTGNYVYGAKQKLMEFTHKKSEIKEFCKPFNNTKEA